METVIRFALIACFSYLLGSIPTALIISKRFFGFDIRQKGSGNMGSTNAFRVLGAKWGTIVMALDILKGITAVCLITWLFQDGIVFPNTTGFEDTTIIKFVAGVCAVIGHIWTVFADFKGGKGINTAAGMLIGIAPIDVSIAIGIFVVAFLLSGYVSLGSIMAAITFPSSLFCRYNFFGVNIPDYDILIYFSLGLSMLLIYTHRKNVVRLLKGNENKFSKMQVVKWTKNKMNR